MPRSSPSVRLTCPKGPPMLFLAASGLCVPVLQKLSLAPHSRRGPPVAMQVVMLELRSLHAFLAAPWQFHGQLMRTRPAVFSVLPFSALQGGSQVLLCMGTHKARPMLTPRGKLSCCWIFCLTICTPCQVLGSSLAIGILSHVNWK